MAAAVAVAAARLYWKLDRYRVILPSMFPEVRVERSIALRRSMVPAAVAAVGASSMPINALPLV
jgi:hypothetical protein